MSQTFWPYIRIPAGTSTNQLLNIPAGAAVRWVHHTGGIGVSANARFTIYDDTNTVSPTNVLWGGVINPGTKTPDLDIQPQRGVVFAPATALPSDILVTYGY